MVPQTGRLMFQNARWEPGPGQCACRVPGEAAPARSGGVVIESCEGRSLGGKDLPSLSRWASPTRAKPPAVPCVAIAAAEWPGRAQPSRIPIGPSGHRAESPQPVRRNQSRDGQEVPPGRYCGLRLSGIRAAACARPRRLPAAAADGRQSVRRRPAAWLRTDPGRQGRHASCRAAPQAWRVSGSGSWRGSSPCRGR